MHTNRDDKLVSGMPSTGQGGDKTRKQAAFKADFGESTSKHDAPMD